MYLKPKKCEFVRKRIKYLGMIISHNSVSMDPVKLAGIQNWLTLTTVKEVWSFLGFGNYYQWFIKKFAHLAWSLNNLLKKDAKFEWTNKCQISFEVLKKKFSKEPVLMMPDQTKPLQIKTDASKYASGAVLTQTNMNGKWHPIAFLSKTFTKTERNHDVYDRELLAIIRALTEWRHYIQGTNHTTMIYSDHKNLTYISLKYSEPEPKTGMMVITLVRVWHQITSYAGNQNDTSWCLIQKIWSLPKGWPW